MKKNLLLFALVFSSALYQVSNAQVGINVNIGSQPVWGPSGYDYAEYYYFPDINAYYHIPDRQFIYYDRGNWASNYSLPPCYSNFNLYNGYKVVINEPRPYLRNDFWLSRYGSYRGRRQDIIYNSRDPRYFVINDHPQHASWLAAVANRRHDNRGYDNHGYDNRRFDNRGFDDHRFDNNQRPNDNRRNDRYQNDNRRWNQNDRGGRDNNRFDNRNNDGFHDGRGR